MFFPEGGVRVWVYGQPTDMRKSFDGLYALVRNALRQDPLSGALFVFINRRGTQTKFCTGTAPASACGPSAWSRGVWCRTGVRCATVRWTGPN